MGRCPRCHNPVDRHLLAQSSEIRTPLLALIHAALPTWLPADGLCPACVLHFAHQLAEARSTQSLHTTTEPHTTFPFYHPGEETVLSQPERLPDHHGFSGRGVTIAFLDSGYYPHPDLCTTTSWAKSPQWARLTPVQMRRLIEQAEPRIRHYVDLTDGVESDGSSHSSLWNGEGYSWHGQMTTTLAAGNGALSNGHFRGYAHQAQLLPIKIGRSTGRIPEEDILAGLQWLLRDDNWARYGVRVLNVAVGGDFLQPWHKNPVCLAAEALSARGVLICAASGNSGRDELVAPAQTPAVLTVGGYEDHNLRWNPHLAADVARLTLYHHNYGPVTKAGQRWRKPEILALGRWSPAPILPPAAVFREVYALGELRQVLQAYQPAALTTDSAHLDTTPALLPDVWEVLRKRMNTHKWVHPYYQHVDGTSVAVTQVSAVAAQMSEANPQLTGPALKELLLATARPVPALPVKMTGRGVLQPTLAVAAALRTHGGRLTGWPPSGTRLASGELHKWLIQGKVSHAEIIDFPGGEPSQAVYVGVFAPQARRVSITGAWQGWQPHLLALHPLVNGWWHLVIHLPTGTHPYRFWIEQADGTCTWVADPENPARRESGYRQDHSLIQID